MTQTAASCRERRCLLRECKQTQWHTREKSVLNSNTGLHQTLSSCAWSPTTFARVCLRSYATAQPLIVFRGHNSQQWGWWRQGILIACFSRVPGLYNRGFIYLDVPISDDSCISGLSVCVAVFVCAHSTIPLLSNNSVDWTLQPRNCSTGSGSVLSNFALSAQVIHFCLFIYLYT